MTVQILNDDCISAMRLEIDDGSINCVVTSPPYFGLRDYGTATWTGGSEFCNHKKTTARKDGGRENVSGFHGSARANSDKGGICYSKICLKCGAIRTDGQLGLEETPEEYVSKLVDVFREVRRVLRDDGTVWLVLGDSYSPNWTSLRGSTGGGGFKSNIRTRWTRLPGYKPKDLIGIPWMVAFALRADGWYLRNEIIWAKPNPMPESVKDRCTKSHENMFLLSKSGKSTIWQARDTGEWSNTPDKTERVILFDGSNVPRWRSQSYYCDMEAIKEPSVPSTKPAGNKKSATRGRLNPGAWDKNPNAAKSTPPFKNKRDVWTVASQPYKGAHFATFPPKLIEPCILAGCPVGGTVLDPFGGAGTVGLVAKQHDRNAILIELNSEYAEMARKRIGL